MFPVILCLLVQSLSEFLWAVEGDRCTTMRIQFWLNEGLLAGKFVSFAYLGRNVDPCKIFDCPWQTFHDLEHLACQFCDANIALSHGHHCQLLGL